MVVATHLEEGLLISRLTKQKTKAKYPSLIHASFQADWNLEYAEFVLAITLAITLSDSLYA